MTLQESIKTYLDARAQDDEQFAQSYAKEGKSLDQCILYIYQEVRKMNTGNARCVAVADVQEEGKEMHHCVFSCEYYKRKDSLLLTARVGGKREETVEFSLRSGAVLQSRAVCNKTTPLHSNIIQLVEDNAARLIALSKTAETAR